VCVVKEWVFLVGCTGTGPVRKAPVPVILMHPQKVGAECVFRNWKLTSSTNHFLLSQFHIWMVCSRVYFFLKWPHYVSSQSDFPCTSHINSTSIAACSPVGPTLRYWSSFLISPHTISLSYIFVNFYFIWFEFIVFMVKWCLICSKWLGTIIHLHFIYFYSY